MSDLGRYLKQLRMSQDRSRRWVEKRSRELYPKDKERHISHSYLRQLEEGIRDNPAKLKLHTLAEIYGVPPGQVLAAAGYLEGGQEMPLPASASQGSEERHELAGKMFDLLEGGGIHPEYFIRAMLGLSQDSLYIVNRLVTTLSVKEAQLLQKQEAADE